jgi:hypothetical protein
VVAAVTALCIAPSQKYIEQANLNSRILKVKGVQLSTSHDMLSSETTMAIDAEPTVPPKLLQTLIDKSVNKTLAQQIHHLSLKEVRGAPDTSAGTSLKKKQENNKKAAAGCQPATDVPTFSYRYSLYDISKKKIILPLCSLIDVQAKNFS